MAECLDKFIAVMPSPTRKGVAMLAKTEVPGVWMVAASRAEGVKIPTEHAAFVRFLQQVSEGLGFRVLGCSVLGFRVLDFRVSSCSVLGGAPSTLRRLIRFLVPHEWNAPY